MLNTQEKHAMHYTSIGHMYIHVKPRYYLLYTFYTLQLMSAKCVHLDSTHILYMYNIFTLLTLARRSRISVDI